MKLCRWVSLLALLFVVVFSGGPAMAHEGQRQVVFDEGHGQRFLISANEPLALSSLAGLFRQAGFSVKANKGVISSAVLAEADVLVISGAFISFSKKEIAAVTEFVKEGGRLCIMLHIGMPVEQLLRKMGVLVSRGVVREEVNLLGGVVTNYSVADLKAHELFQGVTTFNVYGGWAFMKDVGANARIIARTGIKAWIDLNGNNRRDDNEAQGRLGLVAAGQFGKGRFVFFGDDAIFQNRFLTLGNLVLGRNLVKWLGDTEKKDF